jgi:selenocysteine lyase/cysteine desulfurase
VDYRDEFPVTKSWAFLNHANVAPLSRRAQEKLHHWCDDVALNGDTTIKSWFEEIEAVRHAVARLLHASPDEVAFLKNTSEGISMVAEGFPWRHGDNVVTCAGDYPANVYPWMHLERLGVTVKRVGNSHGSVSVKELSSAVDKRTRLVALSFVHFASGFRNDLALIGGFCRTHGIEFLVDAMQGLGVFDIDVKAMHVDYLCANSQKWLVAPQGAAVLFVDEAKLEGLRPISVGWKSVREPHKYSQIDFRLRRDSGRFECGSFIIPSIIALGGSLSLLEEVGVRTVQDRVKEITDYLVHQLLAIGATITSERVGEKWSGIVSFCIPGIDPEKAVERARERHVAISARAGRIRVSPHFYNNREDIDRLIASLKSDPTV